MVFSQSFCSFQGQYEKSKNFRFLTEQKGYSGNQLALRYVLDNPHISSAVFNTICIEHLIDDLGAADIIMPEEIRKQIKKRA